ncbi:hypothetical protein [Corynebacterium pelargi]|uniref:Uncharacterized protein n=1 Tax=Corynebacterium pelargi TaxID=1471400 RepID=A0A410W9X6_9CORY|nr:hypothetical protein [Corynebacterium pelargi]QAU52752.1 hypothetical protein CPELA_07460 [Corynebacterium pelargi]GGG78553.1 hypothetical protein GCM10007338_15810 [Corynebacterium pelargi]
MSTEAAPVRPQLAMLIARALGNGAFILPGLIFAAYAFAHPGSVHYLLPLVLFGTAAYAAPFAQRAFQLIHNPIAGARIALSIGVVGVLGMLIASIAEPHGGLSWDICAIIIGASMGLIHPLLATIADDAAPQQQQWHHLILLALAVLLLLLRATHPAIAWGVLAAVLACALLAVARIELKPGIDWQHRDASPLYALSTIAMVLFALGVRLSRQTTMVWVLIGSFLALLVLIAFERKLKTKSMPLALRESIVAAGIRNFAWFFPTLACIAMNNAGLLLAVITCYVGGLVLAPRFAHTGSTRRRVVIGTIGFLILAVAMPGWWMLPGVLLSSFGAQLLRLRALQALEQDLSIPRSERRLVLARCEAIGALGQQWLSLALLALGSAGLMQQPGAAVSAFVWHAGISEQVATIYQIVALLMVLSFAVCARLLLSHGRADSGSPAPEH